MRSADGSERSSECSRVRPPALTVGETRAASRSTWLRSSVPTLSRLTLGTYGMCDECGEPIDGERLAILPSAVTCLDCKRRLETEKQPFEEPGTGFRSGFGDVRDEDEDE